MKESPSPGATYAIGLRSVSRTGLLTVLERTTCTDGTSVLEALGFSEVGERM
jgi:hypothetical protein